jgi:hypothetical protein
MINNYQKQFYERGVFWQKDFERTIVLNAKYTHWFIKFRLDLKIKTFSTFLDSKKNLMHENIYTCEKSSPPCELSYFPLLDFSQLNCFM